MKEAKASRESIEVDGLDALLAAGRRLQEVDPESFAQVLAAARAFVAAHDRPNEADEIFASRLREIAPRKPRLFD